MMEYHIQENIGRARYVLSFHDGEKTHADGSPFYDVRIFRNKRKLARAVRTLKKGARP